MGDAGWRQGSEDSTLPSEPNSEGSEPDSEAAEPNPQGSEANPEGEAIGGQTLVLLSEAVVPYLRMSGRWLEEHGFAIGSGVQVVVERGRVTLISEAVEALGPVAPAK